MQKYKASVGRRRIEQICFRGQKRLNSVRISRGAKPILHIQVFAGIYIRTRKVENYIYIDSIMVVNTIFDFISENGGTWKFAIIIGSPDLRNSVGRVKKRQTN